MWTLERLSAQGEPVSRFLDSPGSITFICKPVDPEAIILSAFFLFFDIFCYSFVIQDLSSLTRDRTCIPCIGRKHAVLTTRLQGSPPSASFLKLLNSGPLHHPLSKYQTTRDSSYVSRLTAAAAKSLQSCPTLRPHRQQPTRLLRPWDFPGKSTGVGCHLLFWSGLTIIIQTSQSC